MGLSSLKIRSNKRLSYEEVNGGRSSWILSRRRGQSEDEGIFWLALGAKQKTLSFNSNVLSLEDEATGLPGAKNARHLRKMIARLSCLAPRPQPVRKAKKGRRSLELFRSFFVFVGLRINLIAAACPAMMPREILI